MKKLILTVVFSIFWLFAGILIISQKSFASNLINPPSYLNNIKITHSKSIGASVEYAIIMFLFDSETMNFFIEEKRFNYLYCADEIKIEYVGSGYEKTVYKLTFYLNNGKQKVFKLAIVNKFTKFLATKNLDQDFQSALNTYKKMGLDKKSVALYYFYNNGFLIGDFIEGRHLIGLKELSYMQTYLFVSTFENSFGLFYPDLNRYNVLYNEAKKTYKIIDYPLLWLEGSAINWDFLRFSEFINKHKLNVHGVIDGLMANKNPLEILRKLLKKIKYYQYDKKTYRRYFTGFEKNKPMLYAV